MIQGEYWIDGGSIQYADGDIGDYNHEAIATNAVVFSYSDEILDYAQELGIDTRKYKFMEEFFPAEELLDKITNALYENEVVDSYEAAEAEILKTLGTDKETLEILIGGGDARLYVMQRNGWIAVRGENVELHGLDQEKVRSLVSGIHDILETEGIRDEVADLDFSIYDHKTKRTINVSLKDLEEGNLFKPKLPPQAPSHQILPAPRGTRYGRDLWRGTSENTIVFDFKTFVINENQKS